ncbi:MULTISPECIES: HD-GYP domain-containing protein [unclassified Bacillus (in: firmicutes)]|uniref:HD-GYP domain-containing protein n=1 Tax=unclassified Bacillus (in: firmicutes) TaxID=185979 RepID=UPI0008E2C65A|nr:MULTISPECIES: HD-GYP domain-containing protein [unclassified Bacillus (in: firmicutes)]SFA89833.1 HDIG domain-containing protein [Bacillus sp. UNCCL13]SFQ85052.1 HDIG domain-containing protein [Bacillus sp. cl95]
MIKEWNRCKDEEQFCPISLKKYGKLFWPLFLISSIGVIIVNFYFDSSFLLSLYAYPVVLISLMRIPAPLFYGLGSLLLGTLYFVKPLSTSLTLYIMAYAVLMLIVRRVVTVSQMNFSKKNEQEELLVNTVFSLAKTIDARDSYTAFHSSNVADYAKKIAKTMGLSQVEIDSIYLAGLLHDIGKISMPDAILQKDGRLTDEEYGIMKKHPEEGYHIIKDIKRLRDLGITDIVRYHHERPDGMGYPLGLKGKEIPVGARILGVADAFDAMTTNRSYRQKLAIETAAGELRRNIGTQFDPESAEAFLTILMKEGKLQEETKVQSGVYAMAN